MRRDTAIAVLMNFRTSKLAFFLVMGAWLSGCVGLSADYEATTVSVQAFRPVPSGDGGGVPDCEIEVLVFMANLEPVELAGGC